MSCETGQIAKRIILTGQHLVDVPQCRLRGNDGPSVHVWRPGVDALGSPLVQWFWTLHLVGLSWWVSSLTNFEEVKILVS